MEESSLEMYWEGTEKIAGNQLERNYWINFIKWNCSNCDVPSVSETFSVSALCFGNRPKSPEMIFTILHPERSYNELQRCLTLIAWNP